MEAEYPQYWPFAPPFLSLHAQAKETYQMHLNGEIGVYVDLRRLSEFNAGHIKGAIPLSRSTDLKLLKRQCGSKKLAVYCW